MNRKEFIKMGGLTISAFIIQPKNVRAMKSIQPEAIYFKDDGIIPNNKLPLLVYHNAFSERGSKRCFTC